MRVRTVPAILLIAFIFVSCSEKRPIPKTSRSLPYTQTRWGNAYFFSEYRQIRSIALVGDEIWAGTDHGLMGWNIHDGSLRIMTEEYGLPGNDVKRLASAGDRMWVLTDKGFASYRGGMWEPASIPCEGCEITEMVVGRDGAVWVATDEPAVLRFVMGTWVKVIYRGSKIMSLAPYGIGSVILSDSTGTLFRCGVTRCKAFKRLDAVITDIYTAGPKDAWLLGGDFLYHLRRGRLDWYHLPIPAKSLRPLGKGYVVVAGHNFYFLRKCTKGGKGKRILRRSDGAPCLEFTKFSSKLPQHIVDVESDGTNLYLGTKRIGVARFDGMALQYFRGDELVAKEAPRQLVCVPSGGCLMNAGKGIYRYDRRRHAFSKVATPSGIEPMLLLRSPEDKAVLVAYNSVNGTLQFMEYEFGEGTWNTLWEVEKKTFKEKPDIRFGAFTKSYIVWLGMVRRGRVEARVFNFKKRKVSRPRNYRNEKGRKVRLRGQYERMVVDQGHRYIITDSGLIHLWKDEEGKHYREYMQGHGLSAEDVAGIAFAGGEVYLATDAGLCVQHSRTGDFECGTILSEISLVDVVTCRNMIYAASTDAIYRMAPGSTKVDRMRAFDNLLSPVITALSCSGEDLWIWHQDSLSIIELNR